MLKSTIFREYDIRGIADSELLSRKTSRNWVVAWALSCGARAAAEPLTVGRDCRLSSTRLRDASR